MGGPYAGENRAGYPHDQKRLALLSLGEDGRPVRGAPPVVYLADRTAAGLPFWRHESLDTPEKLAAAWAECERIVAAKPLPRWLEGFRR